MSDFFASLLCAFRVLRKNPGFTVSALAVLALGIGANTAIFSVVNTVLLRPLPFHDSQSIVTVFHVPPAVAFPGIKTFSVSPANYLDWRKQNDVFDSMSVFAPRALRIGGGSRPQTLLATISDADFFKVLRVKPAVGRFFKQEECQPGHDAVIIVSDAFAQPGDNEPIVIAARGANLLCPGCRDPAFCRCREPGLHIEIGRHNANHLNAAIVELEPLS